MDLRIVIELLQLESIKDMVVHNGSALVAAVRTSNCELVHLILDAEAHPNKHNGKQLPLTEARNVQVARLLVEAGADVNSVEGWFYWNGQFPYGPAVAAATARGNVDLVRYLIGAGIDIYLPLDEIYILMPAVEVGEIEILRMLLQAGVKPDEFSNCCFESGNPMMTPLQRAAAIRDINAVRLLTFIQSWLKPY